jgi:hypothetical protein
MSDGSKPVLAKEKVLSKKEREECYAARDAYYECRVRFVERPSSVR